MKLYLISQCVNNGYDTYSEAVVAATSDEEAKSIHPGGKYDSPGTWADSKDVSTKLIGTAVRGTKKGVICASFHAG